MIRLAVMLALTLGITEANARDWPLTTAQGTTFNCQNPDATADVVVAGDTITLDGGTRAARLLIQDCWGTAADKITVRNDTADTQVVFTNTSNLTSSAINIQNSDHVVVDGTGGYSGMPVGAHCGAPDTALGAATGCGIVIEPGTTYRPNRYISINGVVADANRAEAYPGVRGIEVRGVAIQAAQSFDGTTGVRAGLYCHDLTTTLTYFPGAYREDFVLQNNFVADVYGEGFYCGNNFGECDETATAQGGAASTITLAAGASAVNDQYNGRTITITGGTGDGQTRTISDYVGSTRVATVSVAWATQPDNTSAYEIDLGCVPNRNMTITDNMTVRTGREGINPKLWIEGTNLVARNVVTDAGLRADFQAADEDGAQGVCMTFGNVEADVHDNILDNCAAQGIRFNPRDDMATGPHSVLVYNNVISDTGIFATDLDRRAGIEIIVGGGAAAFTASIYNNTIVRPGGDGIKLDDTTNAIVRNNVVAADTLAADCDNGAPVTPCAYVADGGGGTTVADNVEDTVANLKFLGATNFGLSDATSPAINVADTAPFSATDILGTARPQGAEADAGAYEYIYPVAPVLLPVRRPRGIHQ